jgi:putative acetyltransferase
MLVSYDGPMMASFCAIMPESHKNMKNHNIPSLAIRLAIRLADFNDPRVTDMIQYHRTTARAETAEGCAFSLDISGLQVPDIRLWTIWEGEALMGMGALRVLSPEHGGPAHGEIKTMHTHRDARRKGVGKAMLRHIIDTAIAEDMTRLSLETGSWDYFKPAVALYAAHGFETCGPFADYPNIVSSLFMTKTL